ncbi:MAG: primosomal protein N' [Desulfatitalea sp.]|nr:primosomal protein N' [Desulfatitalea sp.]NNJ99146.1 primosomal protein N' [Desulfatitalea sp.]
MPNSLSQPTDLIEVAVPLPVHDIFTYRVPQAFTGRIAVGIRVLVPFGRRRITGYVVGIGAPPPEATLKSILDVMDDMPLFPGCMLPFFQWVADYYIHPLGEVIQTALPSGINLAERVYFSLSNTGRHALSQAELNEPALRIRQRLEQGPCTKAAIQRRVGKTFLNTSFAEWERRAWVIKQHLMSGGRTRPKTLPFVHLGQPLDDDCRLSASRRKILDTLTQQGPMSVAELKSVVPTAANLVRAMAAAGQVEIKPRQVYRDPFGEPIVPDQAPSLSSEQVQAVVRMAPVLGQGYHTFLLFGVTGSGKTEIYLHMAHRSIAMGLPVIVLVPEIALISQTERAFRARFGDCVALLHSGLSDGERLDQWRRIQRGEVLIAIGARSAVFAPFEAIGLIVVDEEHDDAYKQEGALRYNARDLAVLRAQQQGAVALLGSATPSLQSAYNAQMGKFEKISLYERVDRQMLPQIQVEDLTTMHEVRAADRFLTATLIQSVQETLSRKEQVLIFLNRRGFANTLVCAACGQSVKCAHCDVGLTFHQGINAFQCHYCGFSRAAAARCTRCGSARINRLGIGTERLTDQLKARFPAACVARMDRDTTRRKGALLKILKALRDRRIDILVGTQMVAKGHDYPHITLVGIICADMSLNLPDFRAGERTFQILAQVAGRAGRGQSPGRVILQTYNPRHFSIVAARDQDFEAFYRQEMQFRRALGYPPVTRMIQLRISGRNKGRTADYARRMGDFGVRLQRQTAGFGDLTLLGPIEAPLHRIADRYRWQLLVKGGQVRTLHQYVRSLLFGPEGMAGTGDIAVAVDVDPVYLM